MKGTFMDFTSFLKNFIAQFDETDASEIKAETVFRDLEEWSSMTALGIIGMLDTEFGITITGADIQACKTVQDIFDLAVSKK